MAKGGAHLPPKQSKDGSRIASRPGAKPAEAPTGRHAQAPEAGAEPRRSPSPDKPRPSGGGKRLAPKPAADTPLRSSRPVEGKRIPPKADCPDQPRRPEANATPARRSPEGKLPRPKKRRKIDNFPLWPIVVVLGVVMIFAAWKLIDLLVSYRLDRAAYDALRDIAVVQLTPAPSPTPGPENEPAAPLEPVSEIPLEIDWDILRQTNEEVIGWLYCPDTPISYPIVQAVNNDKYLNLSFEGASSSAGTIFADFNSVLHLRQSHLILYGHNMKDNSMFGTLKSYSDPAYYEKHPLFYFLTPEQSYRVELFAAQTIEAVKANYPTYFSDEGSFSNYIAQMTGSAYWINAAAANTEYQIITMSTCTSSDAQRLVLQGRMVPIE